MKDVQVMVCFHVSERNFELIEKVAELWKLTPKHAIEDMVIDGFNREFIDVRNLHAHVDICDIPE